MDSSSNKLTDLQQDFLRAFFEREHRFFLSGGAALAGFYLGHRTTHDVDLFTLDDILDAGAAVVGDVATRLGASIESIQTAPDFRRMLMRRGAEAVVIDLVRERAAQMLTEKRVVNGIRVDSPEEILANKLCTLLSRSEFRDLVDVRALEMAGYQVEDAVRAARMKDGGFTPAQLAWVLSQIRFDDNWTPPGGASVEELRQYLAGLVSRLTRQAFGG